MRFLLAIFSLNLFALYASAQSITWEKQFHFDKYTSAGIAVETEDQGYLIPVGTSDNGNNGQSWLIKLNKIGHVEWRIKQKNGGDILILRKTKDLYYLLYEFDLFDSIKKITETHYKLLEINGFGDIVWSNDFNITLDLYAPFKIASFGDGSYLFLSALVSPGTYPKYHTPGKMLAQKFRGDHSLIWSDTFNFNLQTSAGSVIITHGNNILIGGFCGNGDFYNSKSFLLFLDSNGNKLNYNPFPYSPDSSEQIQNLCQLKNGNFIVQSSQPHASPVYFTLTDSFGNSLRRWSTYDYPNGIGGIAADGDSLLIYADLSLVSGPLILSKVDTGFKQLWLKKYDETSYYYNVAGQILRTSDKGILMVGTRSTSTFADMVVIKLDSNCNLAKEDLSCVDDFDEPMIQNECGLVYPNPATTTIYINPKNINTGGQPLNLDIFDSRGQLVSASTGIGTRITQKDISFLNKGLYFYRLYAGGQVFCDGKFVKE